MVTTVTGNSHYGDDRHKDDLPRLYAGHTGSMRKWKLLVLMYRVEKVQEVGRAGWDHANPASEQDPLKAIR